MSNCILAFPDQTLSAATITGGSFSASFPLSNLANAALALKARSVDALAASTKFDVNTGSAGKVRVVALVGHNLSIAATLRIRLSAVSDFSTNVYDSGTISAYPNYYDDTSQDWGQPVLTANKPSTAYALAMRYPIFVVTSAAVTAQYCRVEITDTGNSDGYVQLSRCVVAPGLEPPRNFLAGAIWGYETQTRKDNSLNGTAYFDRVEAQKTCQIVIPDATTDVGMGQLLEMMRYLNLDSELFFVADPAATSMVKRQQSFLCRLRQLAAYEYVSYNRGDVGLQLVESI